MLTTHQTYSETEKGNRRPDQTDTIFVVQASCLGPLPLAEKCHKMLHGRFVLVGKTLNRFANFGL